MTRHIVATADELAPGESKRVTAGGRDIALFRIGDEYHAIQDRCPHAGASLCAGRIVGLAVSDRPGAYSLVRQGELLRCPWHGWEFDIRTGQSWCDPTRLHTRSFATSVESGEALEKGPYAAEIYPVAVERDYVLIDTGPPGWIEAVVVRRETVGEGIVSLELARADGTMLPAYEPGAFIDLEIQPGLVRQYSLCGEPGVRERYRVAVLLEAASRGGSAGLHAGLHEGAPVRCGFPRGQFRLGSTRKRTLLIAGGIGITPLMGMALQLARTGADFTLHYLARTPAHAAFLNELRSGPIGPSLRTAFSEGPEASRLDVDHLLAREPDAEVYVCGPQRLLDTLAAAHVRLGLAPDRLHMERFSAGVKKTGAAFTVRAARSGTIFEVPAGRSLAEVLVAHGIAVNLSCEQGVCASCLVPVLAGEPDHRDFVQSAAEKASNTRIAVCCSRARTPVLVLDI